MSKLRSRLERLETATRPRSWAASPPFPEELAGVSRNVFIQAIALQQQGRESEFSEAHRRVWTIWATFDQAVNESGFPFDPFLGSGTTLAAAHLTERVCFGLELDPKYADVIVTRWQSLSGKLAPLDGDGRTFEEIARERRQEAA